MPPGSMATTTPSPSAAWRTESPVASDGTSARGANSGAGDFAAHENGRSRSRTISPCGSSSRKRDGRLCARVPNSVRVAACVSVSRSFARVMPT